MAYFAKLDEINTVVEIQVVNDQECLNENGVVSEEKGVNFLQSLFGGIWKMTAHDGFRKNYAHIGGVYDPARNAFIPIKPHPSWILVEATCQWEPPTPHPNDGKNYYWDEATISWAVAQVVLDPSTYPIVHDGRSIGDMPVTTIGDSNA